MLEGIRHPKDQEAERHDHHRGEQRHADGFAEQAFALRREPRPADRERHDERRRQQPARDHGGGAPPVERVDQPRRRPRGGERDRGEHRGQRARRGESEQRRGDIEAQHPQAQAEEREERRRADQRRHAAVQRDAEGARAARHRRHQRKQDDRHARRRRDPHVDRQAEQRVGERRERDHPAQRAGRDRRAPAAALGGDEAGGEEDECERRGSGHRREIGAKVAQPRHVDGPAPQRHGREHGGEPVRGVRDARQARKKFAAHGSRETNASRMYALSPE